MKTKSLAPVVLICGLSSGCLADDTSAHSAIRLATVDLSESVVNLAKKQASCDEAAIVLEPAPILNIGLSKQELKNALAYFYLKASIQCSFQEASAVVTNLSALALLQPEGNKDAAQAAQLFTQDLVKLWQAEEKYMGIEEAKRKQLEKALPSDNPFDMIKSAQKLGL